MRDIREDLGERAQLIEQQVRATNAHFEKAVQRLQSERDAKIADLKSTLAMIEKITQFENAYRDNVVSLEKPSAPPVSLIDRIRAVNE
jgi:hypothetical protein